MRRRGSFWMVGWVLLGMLALSTALLVLGTRERATQPSALSYGPSGTHALVELLRAQGFDVAIDRSTRPKLKPGDLALGFKVHEPRSIFGDGDALGPTPTERALKQHLMGGGRALVMQLPASFVEATKTAAAGPREAVFKIGAREGEKARITRGDPSPLYVEDAKVETSGSGYTVVADDEQNVVFALFGEGKGILGVLYDGTGGTNRFIGADQNAEFLVRLAGLLVPERGRVVVLEALGGAALEDGLLATIGSWALAAWWQLILLFVVVAYSLGRRFGLPESPKYRQRSGRELVDAYADVMRRAHMPHLALQKVVQEADREIRRKFSVSSDLSPHRRNEMLPSELAQALSRAELASNDRIGEGAAVGLLAELEEKMSPYFKAKAARRRKKR